MITSAGRKLILQTFASSSFSAADNLNLMFLPELDAAFAEFDNNKNFDLHSHTKKSKQDFDAKAQFFFRG